VKLFSRREITLFSVLILSLGIIAALITVLVNLPKTTVQQEDTLTVKDIGKPIRKLELSDFLLPDKYQNPFFVDFVLSRERKKTWTEEEIQKYWYNPEEIGLEFFKKQNLIQIDEFLKKIP